jgi:ABC-2 type transport system ATP-binding protein
MPGDTPMIEARGLRVDYDDLCAVRDLNLQAGAGEIYGLIGANGAGKTTTLKALAGLLDPTCGEIRIGGVDVEERPDEARRRLGFMPDLAPLYEDLLVWEYLDLFAAAYGIPRAERRAAIEAALERVNLVEKRAAFTGELSRGMRQRLALAKTLLPGPQVLLLDEPASGMDPHGRAFLKEVLRRLRAEGTTVLLSSHILAEMSEFCTSVGIMDRGAMVLSGRVEEVAARVLGSARLVVEILAGRADLERIVAGDPRSGPVRGDGLSYEFAFDGGPEAASELLRALVAAGVRVVSFSRRREDLEQVFLRLGATERPE